MKNYAEELVYWYLRLQGFLLINDWVYNYIDINNANRRVVNSDIDILAIRMRNYEETLGCYSLVSKINKQIDKENKHNLEWLKYSLDSTVKSDINIKRANVGVVCYVSMRDAFNPGSMFQKKANGKHLLIDQYKRIGIGPKNLMDRIDNINKYYSINGKNHLLNIAIGKNINDNCSNTCCYYINISNIVSYIKGHFLFWSDSNISNQVSKQYGMKCTGWHLYPSNLLQYLLKHPTG